MAEKLEFAWNTGRRYTKSGQRIGAVQVNEKTIVFADIDRMIWGVVNMGDEKVSDQVGIRVSVMNAYDGHTYSLPSEIEEYEAINRASDLAEKAEAR